MIQNKYGDEIMKISVIIPTRNAEFYMENLLEQLERQTKKANEIIVIDSESKDNTRVICEKYKNVRFIEIKQSTFNHGGTRNEAAKLATGDILVFMTQDGYPADEFFLEKLTEKLGTDNIVASCGRQMARKDAKPLESFARKFNYKDYDDIKSLDDVDRLGIKTFFLTNVCSAFIADEFWAVGGFPEKVILNEDMLISSKLIIKGNKIHYASSAKVVHSHSYTYKQQFERYFDIGVSLKENEEVLKYAASESEGVSFVKEGIKYLINNKKSYLIPSLIIESGFKFIGYRLGLVYDKLPKKMVVSCSMHKFYWNK